MSVDRMAFRRLRMDLLKAGYEIARTLEEQWPDQSYEIARICKSLEDVASFEEGIGTVDMVVERFDRVDRHLRLTSIGIDWPYLRLAWARFLIDGGKLDRAESHLTGLAGRLALRPSDSKILSEIERDLEKCRSTRSQQGDNTA